MSSVLVRMAVIGWAVLGAARAHGCATCFGVSDAPMAQGMNMGIFSLLGVIGLVLAGVVAFFVAMAVRAVRQPDLLDGEDESGWTSRPGVQSGRSGWEGRD